MKRDNVKKIINVSYFQTIGYLRKKISEAFGIPIKEFTMSTKQTSLESEDDDSYIKEFGYISNILVTRIKNPFTEHHPKVLISHN